MKYALVFAFVGILLIVAGCIQGNTPIVGNDTDAHGCKGSAGYSWCDAKQKCLRAWEENCTLVNDTTQPCRNESVPCGVDNVSCCPGLKKVNFCMPDENNQCICASCGFVCLPCGNGVCNEHENWCNCPEDCKKNETNVTLARSDAGASSLIQECSGQDYIDRTADYIIEGKL